MAYQWKEQVVLITGGAAGIGAAVVKAVIEEGAKHVALLDVNVSAGLTLQNDMNSKYGDNKTKFYECDVADEEKFLQTFATVKDECDYIDVVINNAGIVNEGLTMFRKVIEVNLTAVVSGTYKAVEMMRKDKGGRGGTVINISSIAALAPVELLLVYSATKTAILQFSNCIGMHRYYSQTGVRVLTICFGATKTALTVPQSIGLFDPNLLDELIDLFSKNKSQTPEFAAKGVVDVFKNGESASAWIIMADKPALDITDDIQKAYGIMSSKIE